MAELIQFALFLSCDKKRRSYFNKYEFFEYEKEEYSQFNAAFATNREKVLQSISQLLYRVCSFPLRLKLHASNKCNMNCRKRNLDRKFHVPVSKAYIDNLIILLPYLENLEIYGGEPLICETARWILFSGLLKDCPHVHFSTITNASLLNDRILQS